MPRTTKSRRLFQRLSKMSWEELLFRSRQVLRNRWEGFLYRMGGESLVDRRAPVPLAIEVPRGRFFFSAEELPAIVAILQARFPEGAGQTIARADRICAHRFDLLGYTSLDLGDEIDWHLDPVHKKTAPRKLWCRIPYLDFECVGDVKITWELNRHQHWVTLGRTFRLTGEEKYAAEFVRQFYDWQKQNPYPVGINWSSSLEVAFRSLSWLWAVELFGGSGSLTGDFRRDLLLALGRNAGFIERNLSLYFSPNTHLLGEAAALFFIGVLCPGLHGAAQWKDLGWNVILEQARRQVRNDGGYFEQSIYYHVYALDFLLHARMLAARNGVPIPADFERTILRMLEYLAALAETGPVPRFGDDDGGRVFDGCRNRSDHLLDPLSTGAVLFERSDFKAVAGKLCEETVWLLGPSSLGIFDRLSPGPRDARRNVFVETGTYLLQSEGLRMAVDAGPLGTARGGHGHADLLSVCVSVDGVEWLGDPGTFTYTGSEEWRNKFRGTRAHNTLSVDELDQAEPTEPFAWSRLPKITVERWLDGKTFALLVASHDGYLRLPSPAVHRRVVFFVKGRFWMVLDQVEGHGRHRLEISWHSPAPQLILEDSRHAVARRLGRGFGFVALSDPKWLVEVGEGFFSPAYGLREPSRVLRCAAETQLPTEYSTLLLPHWEASNRRVRLERMRGTAETCSARGYEYLTEDERHTWVFAGSAGVWELGEIESDGGIIYCAQDSQARVVHAVLCDGSFLVVRGEKIFESERRGARFEYRLTGNRQEKYSSELACVSAEVEPARPADTPSASRAESILERG